MVLVWIITRQKLVDLDDVGVGLVALKLVSRSIKTQHKASLLAWVLIQCSVHREVGNFAVTDQQN